MLSLVLALLIVAALAGGAWLAMGGSVLLADLAFAIEIDRPREALVLIRYAALALLLGLLLVGVGTVGWARIVL